jgi:hypothetical protein
MIDHDYICPYDEKSMRIITIELLHDKMKKIGMNPLKIDDQEKAITTITYHNQIIDLLYNENKTTSHQFVQNLTKSATGRVDPNCFYYCFMAVSSLGQVVTDNAEKIGKYTVGLAFSQLTGHSTLSASALMALLDMNNIDTNTLANTIAHDAVTTTAGKLVNRVNTLSKMPFHKIGELMKKASSIYNKYGNTITKNDFKILAELLVILVPEDGILRKAVFQTKQEFLTNTPYVYYPTVEGDALEKIKDVYFMDNIEVKNEYIDRLNR